MLITASGGDDKRIDRFINNFYYSALGRAPSAQELSQQHTEFLQAAEQGVPQLVAVVESLGQQLFDVDDPHSEYSERGRSDQEFLSDLCFAYLQRPSEENGVKLTYEVDHIGEDHSRVEVRDQFVSKAEAEFAGLMATL